MSSLRRTLGHIAILAALSVFLTACGGSSGGNNGGGPMTPLPPPLPPPPPPPTSFNQVVLDEFAATADDTDPRAVDGLDLTFDEDPAAFDSLLQ